MDNPQDISRVCNLDVGTRGHLCSVCPHVEESCLLACSYNFVNGRSLGESVELTSL